jgi:hypothetical protein
MGPMAVEFGTKTAVASGLHWSTLHPSPQRKQGKTRAITQNSGPDSLARASGLDGKPGCPRSNRSAPNPCVPCPPYTGRR